MSNITVDNTHPAAWAKTQREIKTVNAALMLAAAIDAWDFNHDMILPPPVRYELNNYRNSIING